MSNFFLVSKIQKSRSILLVALTSDGSSQVMQTGHCTLGQLVAPWDSCAILIHFPPHMGQCRNCLTPSQMLLKKKSAVELKHAHKYTKVLTSLTKKSNTEVKICSI